MSETKVRTNEQANEPRAKGIQNTAEITIGILIMTVILHLGMQQGTVNLPEYTLKTLEDTGAVVLEIKNLQNAKGVAMLVSDPQNKEGTKAIETSSEEILTLREEGTFGVGSRVELVKPLEAAGKETKEWAQEWDKDPQQWETTTGARIEEGK